MMHRVGSDEKFREHAGPGLRTPMHPRHAHPRGGCPGSSRQRTVTPVQVLAELPDLEPEDIQACLQYASRRLNHPVLCNIPF